MDSWTMRASGADDAEFLFRVYAGTRLEELALTGWSPAQQQAFLRMQFAAQDRDYRQRFAHAHFDVVQVAGTDVGRLYVDDSGAETCVLDIALLPAYRGRGLGSSLLRAVMARAAASGRRVALHVEIDNPAQRLYRRLGFFEVDAHGFHKLMQWVPPGGIVASPERALPRAAIDAGASAPAAAC